MLLYYSSLNLRWLVKSTVCLLGSIDLLKLYHIIISTFLFYVCICKLPIVLIENVIIIYFISKLICMLYTFFNKLTRSTILIHDDYSTVLNIFVQCKNLTRLLLSLIYLNLWLWYFLLYIFFSFSFNLFYHFQFEIKLFICIPLTSFS